MNFPQQSALVTYYFSYGFYALASESIAEVADSRKVEILTREKTVANKVIKL